MNVIRWKPLNNLFSLNEGLGRFFEDRFFDEGMEDCQVKAWNPSTDIVEMEDHYLFKVELPGVKKEDVKVEIEKDTLTIKGERKEETEIKKDDYLRVESFSGSFSRTFKIPEGLEEKKIKASLKDGVMKLEIPKPKEEVIKPISISVN